MTSNDSKPASEAALDFISIGRKPQSHPQLSPNLLRSEDLEEQRFTNVLRNVNTIFSDTFYLNNRMYNLRPYDMKLS